MSAEVGYPKSTVTLKSAPKKGENVNVFLRPGDEANLGVDLSKAKLQIVGGDVIATLPSGGQITFVSMGMLAFEDNAPTVKLPSGSKMNIEQILGKVKDISQAPKDALLVSGPVSLQNEKNENEENHPQQQKQEQHPVNDYNAYYVDPQPQQPQVDEHKFDNCKRIEEPTSLSNTIVNTQVRYIVYHDHKSDGGKGPGPGPDPTPDPVPNPHPVFYFKATAHQYKGIETTDGAGVLNVLGGGGSANGYASEIASAQFESETIDKRAYSGDMIINAENSAYFATDNSANYLSRVLRFAPQMPEGFYIENFTIGSLPSGMTLLDKDGNPIAGNVISKDDMIFKDSLGNIIEYGSPGFLTAIKYAEFAVKYDTTVMPSQLDLSITANYVLDGSYPDNGYPHTNSYTNTYTIITKTISAANDYVYNATAVGGQAEGFVFANNVNGNIIYDGGGNSTIYGGKASDTIYDGGGNDTISGGVGNDTIYGGAGENILDGGADSADKVSYGSVSAYTLSEASALLAHGNITAAEYSNLTGNGVTLEEKMLAYYNGVYVDLAGFTVSGVDFDQDGTDDVINAMSKFVDKTGFTYDANGNATGTTNSNTYNSLVKLGFDKITNTEVVEGSAYNDTIYGDGVSNIISGDAGSDTLDGRAGGDTLLGGSGYDTLYSGSGNDTLDGGSDTDAANFQNSTSGILVRLDTATNTATGYGSDILVNIEDIAGSNFADTIVGNGSTNYLQGMAGDDTFMAGGGYDFIDGGSGSDFLTYYQADYNAIGATNWELINGIVVDLNSSDFTMVKEVTTGRLLDLVKAVERVSGTYGNDVVLGNNSASEVFYGYEGNDTFTSRGGNDTLYGGIGNDVFSPGAGNDTVYGDAGIDSLDIYDGAPGAAIITMDASGNFSYNSGNDLAYSIENIYGSVYNDTITGNAVDNIFSGRNGNDTIDGGLGNDTFNGNNHNDGSDIFDGNGGIDTADYSGSARNITVTLNGATDATVAFTSNGGGDPVTDDVVRNIENFTGGNGNDIITGDANDNILDGWGGTDTISGGGGNDTILARNTSNEILDGGANTDILRLTQNVNFSNGSGTQLISVSNFETLNVGTFNSAMNFSQFSQFDKVTGSGNLYFYSTGAGETLDFTNVDLSSFTGRIYAYGNGGNDVFDFTGTNLSTVTGLYFDGGAGTDTLKLGSNNISMSSANFNTFENFYIDSSGKLTVNGTAGNDALNGGNTMDFSNVVDNDAVVINGLAGTDSMRVKFTDAAKVDFDGGTGSDTLYFTGTINVGDTVTFDNATYGNNFANLETIGLTTATVNGNIVFSANALNAWDNSTAATSLALDVTNSAQASKVSINDFSSATNTTTGLPYSSGAALTTNNYALDANGGGLDLTVQVV